MMRFFTTDVKSENQFTFSLQYNTVLDEKKLPQNANGYSFNQYSEVTFSVNNFCVAEEVQHRHFSTAAKKEIFQLT